MDNKPITVIPHATTFLFAGSFAIGIAVKSIGNDDLRFMAVTTGLAGIILVSAAFALLIALLPYKKLDGYVSIIKKISPWAYPVLFGITIGEIFELLVSFLNNSWLWIIPAAFMILVIIVILLTSSQIFQDPHLLTRLCAVLNVMGLLVLFSDENKLGSVVIFSLSTLLLLVVAVSRPQSITPPP